MSFSIARSCPQCHQYVRVKFESDHPLICSYCSSSWGIIENLNNLSQACPFCQCRQFYKQKDFPQIIGVGIVLTGIIFVPFTFGLSLPICAGLDWLLYKRVNIMVICYKCYTEFRGFPVPHHLKHFLHHIGLKYDKYR